MAMAAANQGIFKMLVPAANAREAAVVEQVAVYPIHTLDDSVGILWGQLVVESINAEIAAFFENLNRYPIDFSAMCAARSLPSGPSWFPRPADIMC